MQSANANIKRFVINHGLLIVLFLTVVGITIASPVFLSYANVVNIFDRFPFWESCRSA